MTNHFKRQAFLYYSLLLIGIILLSTNLSEMKFSPAVPFPESGDETLSSSPAVIYETTSLPWLQGVLALVAIISLVYITIGLATQMKPKHFRPVLGILLGILALFAILAILPPAQFPFRSVDFLNPAAPPIPARPALPLGKPPDWVTWAVIISLILLTLLLIIWVFSQALRRNLSKDRLGREAENALEALRSGQEFTNVILRCYLQMQQALKDELGIEREAHFTTQEFQKQLEAKGIPPLPLTQLTSLFEKVRYGHKQTSGEDEQTAIDCLTDIAQYCRGQG